MKCFDGSIRFLLVIRTVLDNRVEDCTLMLPL